jgi:hypothetical protein
MNPEEEVARMFRECVTLTDLAKRLEVGEPNLRLWMGKRWPVVRLKGGIPTVTQETCLAILEEARKQGMYNVAEELPNAPQPTTDNSDQVGTLAYRKKYPTMWCETPKQKIKAPTSKELARKQGSGGGLQFIDFSQYP